MSSNDEETVLTFTYKYTSDYWEGPLRKLWSNRRNLKMFMNQLNHWKAEHPQLEIVWPESATVHIRSCER